jgi:hypothetical protein
MSPYCLAKTKLLIIWFAAINCIPAVHESQKQLVLPINKIDCSNKKGNSLGVYRDDAPARSGSCSMMLVWDIRSNCVESFATSPIGKFSEADIDYEMSFTKTVSPPVFDSERGMYAFERTFAYKLGQTLHGNATVNQQYRLTCEEQFDGAGLPDLITFDGYDEFNVSLETRYDENKKSQEPDTLYRCWFSFWK